MKIEKILDRHNLELKSVTEDMRTFKQSADFQVNINLGTRLKYVEAESRKMFKEMNESLEATMDEARTLNKRF